MIDEGFGCGLYLFSIGLFVVGLHVFTTGDINGFQYEGDVIKRAAYASIYFITASYLVYRGYKYNKMLTNDKKQNKENKKDMNKQK